MALGPPELDPSKSKLEARYTVCPTTANFVYKCLGFLQAGTRRLSEPFDRSDGLATFQRLPYIRWEIAERVEVNPGVLQQSVNFPIESG